jgi:hypothetical protein
MKKPESFMIVEDKEFSDEEYEAYERDSASSALDPALYSMLKDLRKKSSEEYTATAVYNIPGCIFGTDGYRLSYHIGRTEKHSRRR